MHAKEVLNFEQFQQFCKIVQDDVSSTKEKFMDLHSLSAGHMELQELLLDLLTASEALQVDVKIYQQYLQNSYTQFLSQSYILQPTYFVQVLKYEGNYVLGLFQSKE